VLSLNMSCIFRFVLQRPLAHVSSSLNAHAGTRANVLLILSTQFIMNEFRLIEFILFDS
jgi:hypothetical protein